MSKAKSLDKCDYIFKFVILGDSAVGKTNLLLRFTDSEYKPSHIPTIGVDFKIKIVQIDGKSTKMQLWDTAGQQRFKTITETYYKGASGVVLVVCSITQVYSVADRKSFNNISNWMNQIEQRQQQNTPKIIVANKCDLSSKERCVTEQEGRELSQRYGTMFIEASAKTGQNVNMVFQLLGRQVLQKVTKQQSRQESTMNSHLSKRRLQEKPNKLQCCKA